VVERLKGNATTDFGAPGAIPGKDGRPFGGSDLQRFQAILKACWLALDEAVQAATGKELRKGPRGGGRDLEKILQHVLGADQGYLSKLGGKLEKSQADDLRGEIIRTRQAILEGLSLAAVGGISAQGPRGGTRWSPRYFVRRSAWHVLDHAWEIEDRIYNKYLWKKDYKKYSPGLAWDHAGLAKN
jgi:hypothetical protein